MNSWEFRNDPLFLRNQFEKIGSFEIPVIKRQDIDLKNIKLLGYDHTKPNDHENSDKFVHFFLDDYKFESLWNNPVPSI